MYDISIDELITKLEEFRVLRCKGVEKLETKAVTTEMFMEMLNNILNGVGDDSSFVSEKMNRLLTHSVGINSCVYGDKQICDVKMSNVNEIIFHTSFDAEHTKLYIDTMYNFIWTKRSHTKEEELVFNTHYRYFMDEHANESEKSKSIYSFRITAVIDRMLQLS